MQYLIALGGGSYGIESEILWTNYILEAFGNAKTSRNDNSSQFSGRKGNKLPYLSAWNFYIFIFHLWTYQSHLSSQDLRVMQLVWREVIPCLLPTFCWCLINS
ncbi:hypothetical protein ACB092_02G011400 [Castanea dentata]